MFYYHPLFQNENKKEGFHTYRVREGIVHVHTIRSINTFSTQIQSHDTHVEYDQSRGCRACGTS